MHALLPQIAPRHVGNACEGQVVLIGDHAQVRQRILDLLAVEKLRAAVNRVGQLPLAEYFLKRARYIVRAVEHRDVSKRHALRLQQCNLPGDPRRFVRSRVRMVIPDRLTVRQRGQQLFFDAVHVFIDQ